MKKICFLSVAALSIVAITGCGGRKPSGDIDIDSSKAQLRIYTYKGGVGDQWLKNAAKVFEEKNKDREDFEDGKKGVQIQIQMDRSASGGDLEFTDLNFDIYFTENVDYYSLTNKNKFADITDILTTPNSEDGNKKIIDKIDSNLVSYMNRKNKYYAVPFYDCLYGLVYDKDLFSDMSFYMKDDDTFTDDPALFGTGPNGVPGDWDDGLPKTYDQFKKMINKMVMVNQVIPFTYSSGIATYYTSRALTSYWSDDNGAANTQLNFTFDGTATNIMESADSIDSNGVPTVSSVSINSSNGYLLKKQAGVYNSLRFARDVLCGDDRNYKGYSSNYDAQSAFINNKILGGSNKPIAMLFEGTWWENEAAPAFDEARSRGGSSFNYGFMPIPKSDKSKIGDATFVNLNNSYGFISATSSQMKLAKEFFSFVHTDEQLKAFTAETNMTRAMKYTFDVAERNNLSSYARDLLAIKESEHVKIIHPVSDLDFFINNPKIFDYSGTTTWVFGTTSYSDNPIIRFIDEKTLSAKTYFEDHYNNLKENDWKTIVK